MVIATKLASLRLETEEGSPLPRDRAPAIAGTPLRRAGTPSGNPFAADWLLEDYLRANGFPILDYEAACRKMDELARHRRRGWEWRPLREQDRGVADWRHAYQAWVNRDTCSAVVNGGLADEIYPRAMPESAWGLVTKIERDFAGRTRFFVSHYDDHAPDPFLAATVDGRQLYVIAEWARPGRREPLIRRRRLAPSGFPLRAWVVLAAITLVAWKVL